MMALTSLEKKVRLMQPVLDSSTMCTRHRRLTAICRGYRSALWDNTSDEIAAKRMFLNLMDLCIYILKPRCIYPIIFMSDTKKP